MPVINRFRFCPAKGSLSNFGGGARNNMMPNHPRYSPPQTRTTCIKGIRDSANACRLANVRVKYIRSPNISPTPNITPVSNPPVKVRATIAITPGPGVITNIKVAIARDSDVANVIEIPKARNRAAFC